MALAVFGVFEIVLGDLGGHRIGFVEIEAITHRQRAAGGDGVVADRGLVLEVFKIMLTEGIRGKEAVVARHPPGRMTEVLGVVENRDAIGLAVALGVIAAPIGALAPRFGRLLQQAHEA